MWRHLGVMRGKKQNNKGMTLIEVLVAMAILAVIITPTLRMFATSTGTNYRAKQRQRATTVGESVMESFKAYSMEHLCKLFNSKSFTGVKNATNMKVEVEGAATGGVLHKDGTLDETATKYTFKIYGAKAESSSYDIEVVATPRKGAGVGEDTLNFESPNKYSDAIISLQETIVREGGAGAADLTVNSVLEELKTKAKNAFVAAYSGSEYSVEKMTISDLERTIDIDVTDDGSVQKVTEALTYSCKVKVDYKKTTASGTPGGTPTTVTGSYTPDTTVTTYQVVFDSAASGDDKYLLKVYDNTDTMKNQKVEERVCKLDNVYLYYFPANKELYGTNCKDQINITSDLTEDLYGGGGADPKGYGKLPLNVYVIRQDPTLLSDLQLNICDAEYKTRFEIKGTENGEGSMTLRHNFGKQLRATAGYSIPVIGHLKGCFEGSSAPVGEIEDEIVQDTNLIYDLELKVYEDTTPESDVFDSAKLLAEFSGSKNE